jgi:hypothetical protein
VEHQKDSLVILKLHGSTLHIASILPIAKNSVTASYPNSACFLGTENGLLEILRWRDFENHIYTGYTTVKFKDEYGNIGKRIDRNSLV